VSAQEYHILQPVQAHWAHGLLLDVGQLLLELLDVPHHGGVARVPRPVVHDAVVLIDLTSGADVVDRLTHHGHGSLTVGQ